MSRRLHRAAHGSPEAAPTTANGHDLVCGDRVRVRLCLADHPAPTGRTSPAHQQVAEALGRLAARRVHRHGGFSHWLTPVALIIISSLYVATVLLMHHAGVR